jgi:hypothetical protein
VSTAGVVRCSWASGGAAHDRDSLGWPRAASWRRGRHPRWSLSPSLRGLLGGLGGGASRLRTWARLDLPSLAGRWCGLCQIERDLAGAILLLSVPGSASPSRVVLAGESGYQSLISRQWGPPCDINVGWLGCVSGEIRLL